MTTAVPIIGWTLFTGVCAVPLLKGTRMLAEWLEERPDGSISKGKSGSLVPITSSLLAFGALAYGFGFGGISGIAGGATTQSPAVFSAPNTPTVDVVVFAATGDSLFWIGSVFSADPGDTHDSTQVQIDTIGTNNWSGSTIYTDSVYLASERDTVPPVSNSGRALDSAAVMKARVRYYGREGGWSAWSDSIQFTMTGNPWAYNEPTGAGWEEIYYNDGCSVDPVADAGGGSYTSGSPTTSRGDGSGRNHWALLNDDSTVADGYDPNLNGSGCTWEGYHPATSPGGVVWNFLFSDLTAVTDTFFGEIYVRLVINEQGLPGHVQKHYYMGIGGSENNKRNDWYLQTSADSAVHNGMNLFSNTSQTNPPQDSIHFPSRIGDTVSALGYFGERYTPRGLESEDVVYEMRIKGSTAVEVFDGEFDYWINNVDQKLLSWGGYQVEWPSDSVGTGRYMGFFRRETASDSDSLSNAFNGFIFQYLGTQSAQAHASKPIPAHSIYIREFKIMGVPITGVDSLSAIHGSGG